MYFIFDTFTVIWILLLVFTMLRTFVYLSKHYTNEVYISLSVLPVQMDVHGLLGEAAQFVFLLPETTAQSGFPCRDRGCL